MVRSRSLPVQRFAGLSVLFLFALFLTACGGGGAGELLGVGTGSPSGGGTPPPPSGQSMSTQELDWSMQVLSLTNQERQQRGVGALTWDDGASQVAYDHCLYQQGQGVISHTGAGNTQPWDRLTNAGIAWSSAGENVAVGQGSPTSVMTAWINSPGHYANLIRPSFTRLGVAAQEGAGGIYAGPWWTQLFYSP